MEAHVGTISIGARKRREARPSRPTQLRKRLRERRLQRAERAYSMRTSGKRASSVPGSEHAHVLHKDF
jgi:hypothetical protein